MQKFNSWTGYNNIDLGGRNMSEWYRKTSRGDVLKKNGPMLHTLTERFFSCNNLIKAQYTCLLVSSLTCKQCKIRNRSSNMPLYLWLRYEKTMACQKPKEEAYFITGLNCHNKCQFRRIEHYRFKDYCKYPTLKTRLANGNIRKPCHPFIRTKKLTIHYPQKWHRG